MVDKCLSGCPIHESHHLVQDKHKFNCSAYTKENGGSFLVLVSIELLRSQMLAKWKTYNNVLVTSTLFGGFRFTLVV